MHGVIRTVILLRCGGTYGDRITLRWCVGGHITLQGYVGGRITLHYGVSVTAPQGPAATVACTTKHRNTILWVAFSAFRSSILKLIK